jgi:hypothetical protein
MKYSNLYFARTEIVRFIQIASLQAARNDAYATSQ